jgi:hypothetical protein
MIRIKKSHAFHACLHLNLVLFLSLYHIYMHLQIIPSTTAYPEPFQSLIERSQSYVDILLEAPKMGHLLTARFLELVPCIHPMVYNSVRH